MTTRKSGLLGLMMLGMSVLAACEKKGETIIIQPPVDTTRLITLTLAPSAHTLTAVGQTVQLVAVVNGSTNQAATCTSSNTSVATVNASTCVVSAVANGTAVITAVSGQDARARASSTITVNIGTVLPPANPSISIQRITVAGNINAPVNTQNTMGQIDVTLNLEVPPGAQISRVETVVDGTVVVCSQSFTATGEIAIDAAGVELVCSFDTAQLDATGAPRFVNGPHNITARVISPSGTTTASTTTTLVFNNQSFITARLDWLTPGTTTVRTTPCVTSGSEPRSLGGPGTSWCGNSDLRVTLTPVVFGTTNDRLARATVTLSTSGIGVSGRDNCNNLTASAASGAVVPEDGGPALLEDGSARVSGGSPNFLTPGVSNATAADGDLLFPGCGVLTMSRTDTDAADGLSVTWLYANTPESSTAGIGGIEDVIAIQVNGITVGGQAGPTCINPDPARNPLSAGGTFFVCGTGSDGGSAPGTAFFPNQIRLDNLAPRATLFDMTPGACPTPPVTNCFINGGFSFAPRSGFFASRDYGSDSQNANTTFSAGTSSTTLAPVVTGADISETVTNDALIVRAQLRDGLGNEALIYPTTTNTTVTTSSTAATIQRFGVDRTAPEFDPALTVLPPNNGANDGLAFTFAFRDAGVGPSGFTATPVSARVELITSGGTSCLNPETGAQLSGGSSGCSTNSGFVATDGTFNVGGVTGNGYYRVTYQLADQAGNTTTQTTIITLIDNNAPGAGGIVAPSIITGNSSASFSSAATDNVDLGDVLPAVVYGGAGITIEETRATVGAYGPPTETSATATATISNFIRSIEMGVGGGINRATEMGFLLRDQAGVVDNAGCPAPLSNGATQVANLAAATPLGTSTAPAAPGGGNRGNCFVRLDPISNAVDAGIPATGANAQTSFSATTMTGFTASTSVATVCNSTGTGAGQPCPTNPSSTTLSATANGPTGFANPFQRVNFYYRDLTTGRSILIGTVTAPTVTDVGGVRSFVWQRTWTPTNLPAGAYTIDIIGVDTKGQGLRAGTTVTVSDD